MALLDATPGRPLINYNYTDFAEGTGISIFYGAHSKITTVNHYLLTGTIIWSTEIQTQTSPPQTNPRLDLDFDLAVFNLPKNMVGTAFISIPFNVQGTNPAGYIIAKLRKVDLDSNEIEIASAQSETLTTASDKKILLKIAVPLTHFKKGEILRLTIEGYGNSASANIVLTVGHDPKERASTEFPGTGTYKTTTSLIAHIPFRLGL